MKRRQPPCNVQARCGAVPLADALATPTVPEHQPETSDPTLR